MIEVNGVTTVARLSARHHCMYFHHGVISGCQDFTNKNKKSQFKVRVSHLLFKEAKCAAFTDVHLVLHVRL